MKSKIREMRALSIAQPWAHAILNFGKNVENRSRQTHYRGTIAIHASAGCDLERFYWLKKDYRITLHPDEADFGAIVGFATIVEVINEDSLSRSTEKWFVGDYGYVLENIIRLKTPVPAKGALGFWKLKGSTLNACLAQLSRRELNSILPFQKL